MCQIFTNQMANVTCLVIFISNGCLNLMVFTGHAKVEVGGSKSLA